MGVLRPFLIPEAKPTLILLNLCLKREFLSIA